jgi:hypothetical protein
MRIIQIYAADRSPSDPEWTLDDAALTRAVNGSTIPSDMWEPSK